jgi:thiosulfate/3-mercaptopyruvate sulfurtransferase
MNKLVSILNPHELLSLPKDNLILIDAGPGPAAFGRYKQQHLAGALYVDLDADLAEIPTDAKDGGRHPLPTPAKFGKLLGKLGITPQSHVVVYDDKNGANAAARFWWMLRAAGHTCVQVLNGGLQAAIAGGYRVSAGIEKATPVQDYPFKAWANLTVTMAEVEVAVQNPQQVVIDVRDANRYNGLTEPIDPIAGHIPGAVNIPLTGNLEENGLFLSREALREKYLDALKGVDAGQAIVHCGSGVTACHTILAMDYAGLPMPKLYVGSYSEWCRNKEVVKTEQQWN